MSAKKHLDDFMWALKWGVIVFFVGALVLVFGFCVPAARNMQESLNRNIEGREFSRAEGQAELMKELQHRFQWAGLSNDSVAGYWMNGFMDHSQLYRILVTRDVFARLKTAIKATPGKAWSDDDANQHPFADLPTPWKPGQPRIPAWWDVENHKGLDVLEWYASDDPNSKGFGLWLGYDSSDQVLFYCSFTF